MNIFILIVIVVILFELPYIRLNHFIIFSAINLNLIVLKYTSVCISWFKLIIHIDLSPQFPLFRSIDFITDLFVQRIPSYYIHLTICRDHGMSGYFCKFRMNRPFNSIVRFLYNIIFAYI